MNTHELYREIEASSEVLAASQHRQVQLLLEKCLQHMFNAKNAIQKNDYATKHHAISRATHILTYLRLCLNFQDPLALEISNQLDALYVFIAKSLVTASLNNDAHHIDQAVNVLIMVKEGWDNIA
jgi:flagellar protein FliS